MKSNRSRRARLASITAADGRPECVYHSSLTGSPQASSGATGTLGREPRIREGSGGRPCSGGLWLCCGGGGGGGGGGGE